MTESIDQILAAYDIYRPFHVIQIGGGLINVTWKIQCDTKSFILQKINHHVFAHPDHIAKNTNSLKNFLREHHPDYLFVAPFPTSNGKLLTHVEDEGYFRLFPFVEGSHTIDVVFTNDQAYQASYQFGKFTKVLSGFDANQLHDTIPGFHDLALRYKQFETAFTKGNVKRRYRAADLIRQTRSMNWIVREYLSIIRDKRIRKRVTHHDTKISNVLFDDGDHGICVIDLDTVMPGFFISDLGDMMRTYLSPASEEEVDFSKIEIRETYFQAIVHGFLESMRGLLSEPEKSYLLYSGYSLIYMQALRFLTDYLNDDIYYGARYEDHNYVRAANQMYLLKQFQEKEMVLKEILKDAVG